MVVITLSITNDDYMKSNEQKSTNNGTQINIDVPHQDQGRRQSSRKKI